jgi:hypothetical protein
VFGYPKSGADPLRRNERGAVGDRRPCDPPTGGGYFFSPSIDALKEVLAR